MDTSTNKVKQADANKMKQLEHKILAASVKLKAALVEYNETVKEANLFLNEFVESEIPFAKITGLENLGDNEFKEIIDLMKRWPTLSGFRGE